MTCTTCATDGCMVSLVSFVWHPLDHVITIDNANVLKVAMNLVMHYSEIDQEIGKQMLRHVFHDPHQSFLHS